MKFKTVRAFAVRLIGTLAAYVLGVLTVASVAAIWIRSPFPVPVLLSRVPPGETFYVWLVERTWLAIAILVGEIVVLAGVLIADHFGLRLRRLRMNP